MTSGCWSKKKCALYQTDATYMQRNIYYNRMTLQNNSLVVISIDFILKIVVVWKSKNIVTIVWICIFQLMTCAVCCWYFKWTKFLYIHVLLQHLGRIQWTHSWLSHKKNQYITWLNHQLSWLNGIFDKVTQLCKWSPSHKVHIYSNIAWGDQLISATIFRKQNCSTIAVVNYDVTSIPLLSMFRCLQLFYIYLICLSWSVFRNG